MDADEAYDEALVFFWDNFGEDDGDDMLQLGDTAFAAGWDAAREYFYSHPE
jgi:hypothetical protein